LFSKYSRRESNIRHEEPGYPAFPQSKSVDPTINEIQENYDDLIFDVSKNLLSLKKTVDQEISNLDKEPKSATRIILDDVIPSGIWKNVTWDGWELSGQNNSLKSCMTWFYKGCLNNNDHPMKKSFIKGIMKKCAKSGCKLCYESWMNREGNSMTQRIEKWMGITKQNVSHVTVSFPQSMHYMYNERQLTKILYKTLKKVGITGGYKILHTCRFDKKTWEPYISPHYHLLCFGWIKNTAEVYEKTGILVKKISTLYKSGEIFNTAKYQLSHCAVKHGRHAAVPFGSISYSKLKVEKEPIESEQCPYCELELVNLRIDPKHTGKPPFIDSDHVGLTSFSGFIPIEKYNVCYYKNWNLVTTSKEMASDKKIKNEELKLIKQKKKERQKQKSKMCSTLENWI